MSCSPGCGAWLIVTWNVPFTIHESQLLQLLVLGKVGRIKRHVIEFSV